MAQNGSVPNLQEILATLAQFSGQNATSTGPEQNVTPSEDGPGIHQNNIDAAVECHDPRPRPQGRASSPASRPMIDPATITVWQDGLRCVTKIAAQNAQFALSIKRMMKDQRAHEMRWYAERQSLKQMQANRSASAAKAQSILKSLNSSFQQSASEDGSSADIDQAKELADHDMKIYTAQVVMEEAMTTELKGLGVPFFGTNHNLVLPDGHSISQAESTESHAKWSQPVTESQLRELQRKMVNHLEDLYRD